MMSVHNVLDKLDDESRLLYLSAVQIRNSAFWNHMNIELDSIVRANREVLVECTMEGNEKGALIAACKIEACGFARREMERIITGIEVLALNQEQEEQNG